MEIRPHRSVYMSESPNIVVTAGKAKAASWYTLSMVQQNNLTHIIPLSVFVTRFVLKLL